MVDSETTTKQGQAALQEILNLTLKLSDEEKIKFAETNMDPERKKFLEGAMQNVLDFDEGKLMAYFTDVLRKHSEQNPVTESQLEELAGLYDEINGLLEGFDMNIVFNNCGGLQACLTLVHAPFTQVQWQACDMIANAVQNNTKCQDTVLKEHGLEKLLNLLVSTGDEMIQIKSIYALSGLVGGNETAENLFVDSEGVKHILKFLSSNSLKVKIKAAFFLNKVLQTDASNKIDKSKLIIPLFACLRKAYSNEHPCIVTCLVSIIESKQSSVNTVFDRVKFELKSILENSIRHLNNDDAKGNQDSIDVYKNLLSFC